MTTNLDNAGFAPELMDVLARFHAETITEAEATDEVLALLNRWYTFNGTVAERLANFLLSIDGFIVTDGAPSDAVGSNGQFALDNTNGKLYGPKAGGEWGDSILTLGGEDGRTILSGTGAPGSGVGVDGDFYYDTDASDFYGPKASGAWPAGVSLIGPQGPKGDTGDTGATGAAATITVGTVSALSPGSTPTVTNSGTSAAAELDFGLVSGAAATVTVGAVTTLAAGESATVTNSGTTAAAELDFGIPQGAKGDQGEGIQFDAVGTFANRSTYDADAAGFQYLSTDGADGLGGPDVMYIRVGASGWSDPVSVQGDKGDKGDDGDLVSLEGFVPYATIITGSGALIPGAAAHFIGASEAVLALDVTTPVLGDLYPLSNGGTANMQIDPGAGGGHIQLGSMSAGDRLTLTPGDGVTLICASLTGPVFTEYQKQ